MFFSLITKAYILSTIVFFFVCTCFAFSQEAKIQVERPIPHYNLKQLPDKAKNYKRLSKYEFEKIITKNYATFDKVIIPANLLADALCKKIAVGNSSDKDYVIDINNCIIEGKLDLQNRETNRSFLCSICIFSDEVNLTNTTFKYPCSFENAEFQQDFIARYAKFQMGISFEDVVFQTRVSFAYAKFLEETSFKGSEFNEGPINDAIEFRSAEFFSLALFDRTKFRVDADFEKTIFQKDVTFDYAQFFHKTIFKSSDFQQKISFRFADVFDDLEFANVIFHSNVFFNYLNANNPIKKAISQATGQLLFYGVRFKGEVFFDGSDVETIKFWNQDNYLIDRVIFEKPSSFQGMQCSSINFTKVYFQEYVDFSKVVVTKFIGFDETIFRDSINFYQTSFPKHLNINEPTGLHLDGVRGFKSTQLEWEQISNNQLITSDPNTWDTIEQAFKRVGNLEAQNEAFLKRKEISNNSNLFDGFLYIFWGHGVRPWRLVFWIVLIHLFFTFIYWTQTKPLENRWSFAFDFSRQTAFTWKYGFSHARGKLFQFVTLIHSYLIKIMLFFLLKAVANVSPLVHELFGKLFPF